MKTQAQGRHDACVRLIAAGTFCLLTMVSARAVNVVQEFYLPMPEQQVYTALNTIVPGSSATQNSTYSIVVTGDGTVVVYDQWEDGYETDLSNPTQSSTQIWGDGNDANGIPPGFAHDPVGLPAGTVITLTNNVPIPRNPSVLLYDGRDRIGGSKALVVTHAGWPASQGPVFAGAVSVYSTIDYGTNYIVPVGQDITNKLFKYVGLFVMAAQNGTTVTIDPDGAGTNVATTVTLNQGESYLVNGGIKKGASVVASKPVQADLIIGDTTTAYAADWFTLTPVEQWSDSYYTPVGSASSGTQPAYVYLYNPNSTNITVNYSTVVGSGSIVVTANNVAQFQMPQKSGASFISAGGAHLYALCTVAANNSNDSPFNWGFSLLPKGGLTSEADVGWAPGSSDLSVNGSPVWVTALGNTTVYVDYKGDHAGSLTDPKGNKYDTSISATALQSVKIFDPSKNQTGMRVYTLDGTLITAAWGEDADTAQSGNPYIDAGTIVLPFPVPVIKKTVTNVVDTFPPGNSVGDTLEYTVELDNKGLLPLGNVVVIDLPPTNLISYVSNTTSLNGQSIADSASGTAFPLDAPGYIIPVIQRAGTSIFKYRVTIIAGGAITNIVNIGSTSISAQSAVSTTTNTSTIGFTDSTGTAATTYVAGTNIYLKLTDPGANTSSNSIQTITVTVVNSTHGDSETITLTETGNNTGVFTNSPLPTSLSAGTQSDDGVLNVVTGDILTVNFTDPFFGNSANASATIVSAPVSKILYLAATNGTQGLDRIDPVFYNHSPTQISTDIGSISGSGTGIIGIDSESVSNKVFGSGPGKVTNSIVVGSGTNALILVAVEAQKASATNVTAFGTSTTNLLTFFKAVTNGTPNDPIISLWYLTNPPSGSYKIVAGISPNNFSQGVAVGVAIFTNVNLSSPLGTFASSIGHASSASVTVTNVSTNGWVFDGLVLDHQSSVTNAGEINLWNGGFPGPPGSGGEFVGAVNLNTNHVTSITNNWTMTGSDYTLVSVAINPSTNSISSGGTGPSTNATSFTQIPNFNSSFTIVSNQTITISNFVTVTNGSLSATPAVTATLLYGTTPIVTLTNATYSSVDGTIFFTGTLPSNVTIPSGQAITYLISNGVPNTAFHVNYDSTTAPSRISLPAGNVIHINSLGVYDAPYPGGNLVTTPPAGATLYVRANVSDPFGNYDITGVNFAITSPSGGANVNTNLTVPVSTNLTSATYELTWQTGATIGNYGIAATANEGTEGIKDVASASVSLIFLDLGTPSTSQFTVGNNGSTTNGFAANSTVCIRVTDVDQNLTNSIAETLTATVTSSAGDSELVTMTETATNSGVFTACISSSTTTGLGNNNGTLYAPVGSQLTLSYTDPTDSTDQSSATAVIIPPPGVPGIAINKTLVSPSSGKAVVGDTLQFNLQVVNTGSTTLPGVALIDTFQSAQMTFQSASLAPDITNATTLQWTNLGSLTPGQSTNISVFFTAASASSATNFAGTSSGATTNSGSASVTITQPALTLTKTLLSPTNSPVSIGSNVVFRIIAKNTGTTTIPTLPMEDTFSAAYLQYVSATIPANGSGAGSLIWTNLASPTALAVGASITNDVTMKVVGAGNPALNTATVDFGVDGNGKPVPATSSTVTNLITAAASINGHVYNDVDQSGTLTAGDLPLESVTLSVYSDPNGDGNPADGTLQQITTTDANGYYEFLNLPVGNYVVVETALPGYGSTVPANGRRAVNATSLTPFANNDFFNYEVNSSAYGTISGTVYYDLNGNGTNDVGETTLANVNIDLVQDVNNNGIADVGEPIAASTTTDTNGAYQFVAIVPNHYVVRETDLFGYYSSGDAQSPNDNQIGINVTAGLTATNQNFYDRLSPTGVNDTASGPRNTGIVISPLGNDISPNGDALTICGAISTNGNVVVNGGATSLTFTPTNLGLSYVTYTLCDAHGGTSTALITVTATNNPPHAANDSYNVNQGATLTVNAPGVLTNDTDLNSDTLSAILGATTTNGVLNLHADGSFTYVPNSNFCGVDTFTYTVNDGIVSGNTATVTITIADSVAPQLSGVPTNITVECSSVPVAPTVTATDSCDPNPTVSLNEVSTQSTNGCGHANYTITRTWTATDASGNSSTASQTITVIDTTAPVIAGVPVDATVQCDNVPAAATPTATDNCDSNPNITFNQTNTPGACVGSYVLTRTWTATDACGNSSSATQTITVIDTTAPVIAGVPGDVTVQCDAVPTAATPTATDNCDNNPSISLNETTVNGPVAGQFVITRTWTATDACGNSSTAVQHITGTDSIAPVLSGVPANVTVECSSVPTAPTVTATDNCDPSPTVSLNENSTQSATGCGHATYTITRTWTATDASGNSRSASQIITVHDTTAPVVVGVPADATVQCDAVPTAPTLTATDNCDTNATVAMVETRFDGACANSYMLTRTWTATDACGNSSSATQTITVIDTTAPVIAGVPGDVTVQCDNVPAAATPTATDNCDSNPNITFNQTNTPGACVGSYVLTRTWTAMDACGNSSSATQTITVIDTTAPVLAGVPGDVTVQCDAVPAAATPTATDNCDSNPSISFNQTMVHGPVAGQFVITRTWTATDACGNSSTAVQHITGTDSVAPVLSGVPANVTVECSSVPTAPTVTATDNCDPSPTVSLNENSTQSASGCGHANYTITRTWTATDASGNSSTASQIITVHDTTAPVVVGVPADATVQCDAVPTAPTLTATDNCDTNATVTMAETRVDGVCSNSYTLTRTWTATDACGNSSTASQHITVIDTTAPLIVGAPSDTTVQCDAVPSAPTLTATDNCDTNAIVAMIETRVDGACANSYTLTRTWTATDACGNSSSATQAITVIDTTAPVISGVPVDATVQCDNVPTAATPTATDNCDNSPSISLNETTVNGPVAGQFVITRTWTATDACGNSSTAVQHITGTDSIAPVLSGVPADVTVECSSIPTAPTVTATDNCDPSPTVSLNENSTQSATGCGHANYTITRTWTATDASGNSRSASQIITVHDTTAPVVVGVPADATVQCDAVPTAPTLTATDNCDTNATVTLAETRVDGACSNSYTLIRTWTATDACGNSSTATQTITVIDTAAPLIVGAPSDTTVQCDAVPTAPTLTATDNCDTNATVGMVETRVDGACANSYTLTRTWTATDACGNSSSATQTITVIDTTAPLIAGVPGDVTVQCDAVPTAATPTATDNCDSNPSISFNESTVNGPVAGRFVITRTWTSTDACGNSSTAVQHITGTDSIAPTLAGVPADLTVECNAVPGAASPTASDNCDPNPTVSLNENSTQSANGCGHANYTITRTWTATDASGNSSTASQTITVHDTTAPVLSAVPADLTVQCYAVPSAGTPTATDNCDANPTVNLNESSTQTANGVGHFNYTITRTWTASDVCGNSSTATQTITVNDTNAPVLSAVPSDVTVQCDAIPSAGTPIATDNCDTNVSVTLSETSTKATNGCGQFNYTITRIWTATDAVGNSSTAQQVITAQDTTAPILSGVPADTTAQCNSVPAPATPTATDNCDSNPTITFNEVQTNGAVAGQFTIVRTWTATDACGNSSTAVQHITGTDTLAPVLSGVPADVTVECSSIPTAPTVTATDNCDPNPTVSLNENSTQSTNGCGHANYTITRTWTATDASGNSSTASQTITLQDTTAPVLSAVPVDATVQCDAVPSAGTPTATDGCDANPTVSLNEVSTQTTNGIGHFNYSITRTWTANDACGNSSTASQTITVQDTTSPVLSAVPADTTVQCDAVPSAGTPVAIDNCDTNATVTLNETSTKAGSGCSQFNYTITRTWTTSDTAGNTSTAQQVVTVIDTSAPVLVAVPVDVTVQCDSVPSAATLTATDNCDSNPTVSLNESSTQLASGCGKFNYTITRTWTATDACGNSSTGVQHVTVHDTSAPLLSGVPADTTAQCDSVPAPATPTAVDNCDPSPVITFNEVQTNGAVAGQFTIVRTWTATDACGNSSTAVQHITGTDTLAPVLSGVPSNVTVECGAVPTAPTVTATDNCDPSPTVSLNENSTQTTNGCGNANYKITRTWTATDASGNSSTASQTITVQDTTAPVLSAVPVDATVQCDAVPSAGTPTATDGCDANPTVSLNEVSTQTTNGVGHFNYSITRTWTASDACGNSSTASQMITVQDTTSPVLSAVPADTTVQCDAVPTAGTPTITDNCDTNATVTLNETSTKGVSGCGQFNYTIARTWTATDTVGNTSTAQQVVTVIDTSAPVMSAVPTDVTVQCESVPSAGTPTATDSCDPNPTVTLNENSTQAGSGCGKFNYTITRTWTATDACGNSSTGVQHVTVHDTTAPVLSGVPADTTAQCNSVPAPATPTATDNCDSSPIITFNEVQTNGAVAGQFTIVRTWTATDACGNSSTAVQHITGNDSITPVLSGVPADVTVECSSIPTAPAVTATDNCDPNPTVSLNENSTQTLNGCGHANYTLTRTWTATDASGNSSTASQTITVHDTTAPVLSAVPADATVECSAVPSAGTPTATDNCDTNPTVNLNETSTQTASGVGHFNYTITRTWTASDACGNSSTGVQHLIVHDTTAPVLSAVPTDATVQCDAVPAAGTPVATDNCDTNATLTVNETSTKGVNGCSQFNYTITRTWTAADTVGNTSTAQQIITVHDTTAPVLSALPADTTVQCNAVPTAATPTAADNCDASPTVSLNETSTQTGSGVGHFNYTITRTWTASDACGNSSTGVQHVTVLDTTAPVLSAVPANATVECNAVPSAGTPVATDNCDANATVTFDETSTKGANGCSQFNYTITRTWTATDTVGNSSTAQQVITVHDTTAPVLSGVPADTTAQCNSVPTAATPTATDNCDASPTVSLNETSTQAPSGSGKFNYIITRTWTASDACGNSSTGVQHVTVHDTSAPVLSAVPADLTVECNAVPSAGTPTATDNCDASPTVSLNETSTQTANGVGHFNYTITRTWTATDTVGNSSTGVQHVTVHDTTAPVLSAVPANVTVECNAVPSAGTPVATDNCDTNATVTLNETSTKGASGCSQFNYTITRTWTATDTVGNSSTAQQIITVHDTTAPVLSGVPADATVQCNTVPTAGNPTATDNCDSSPTVSLNETSTQSASGCGKFNYTITRTWTATDACGNTSTAVQHVTVHDTTAPVLSGVPADTTAQCNNVPAPATPTATDNCDASPTVTFSEVQTNGAVAGQFTIVRTWTATDACGNSSTAVQHITGTDSIAPVLTGVPGDVTVECNSIPTAPTVTATDNCDPNPTVSVNENSTQTTNGCGHANYILTRTWTATDASGNSSTASQTITVHDTTAPVLSAVPADATVECSAVPSAGTPTATDNCDPNPTVTLNQTSTQTPSGVGHFNYMITRTWTATDACGNSSTGVQHLTVHDTTAPVLSGVPADTTAQCNNVPAPATPTATDNCDANPTVTLNVSSTQTASGCGKFSYSITRTWTATDVAGNTSTGVQHLTVIDTTAPILSGVPADTTVQCSSVPAPATPTATDNCDANPTVTFNEVQTNGAVAGQFTIVRTWTATDACGNSSRAVQHITGTDSIAPVLSGVPGNMTVECSSIPTAPTVTATDNCDPSPTVSMNQSSTQTANGCTHANYTITRTWTATDASGNSSTASQTITVHDTTAPVLSGVPADATIECSAVPSAGTPTATDNCDPNPTVTLNQTSTQTANGVGHFNYTITRTWTATDACGNSSTGVQHLTVHDTTAPILSGVPADATAQCNNVPAPATPTATDNCDANPTVTLNESSTQAASGCGKFSYSITRTWTATDVAGNTSTGVQHVTVIDTTAPTLSGVPADTTVQCSSVPAPATPTATDNCDANPTVTFSEVQTNGAVAGQFTIVRTWTATDACGNSSTAVQHITGTDSIAPVLSGVPANVTVECSSIPTAPTVTAADNCDPSPTVSMNQSSTQTANGCTHANYTITRTWTATDASGNSSTASQTITVHDTTAPVLSAVPADATVECNAVPSAGTPTATDNCDPNPTVTLNQTSTQTANGVGHFNYTITRTWTATDACGNSSTGVQHLTVHDTIAPVLSAVPANSTVQCDAVPSAGTPTVTDNCDTDATVTLNETSTKGASGCSQFNYTITRTWTATDTAGNSSTAQQVITVHDSTAPVFSGVPADTTVQCSSVPAPATPTATDNCDANPTITFSEVQTNGAVAGQFTIVRTWTATDACGNSSTAVQHITGTDSIAPVLSGVPANVTVECSSIPTAPTVTATDNCDPSPTVSLNQSSTQTANGCTHANYTITRTWTATDASGNSSTASQTITVHDTTAPLLSAVPADATVECSAVPSAGTPTATDNCDPNPTVTLNQTSTQTASGVGHFNYTITRTWTATDACGNSSTGAQHLTVHDTTAPVLSGVPADTTAQCNNVPAPATPTATDNCDVNPTVTLNVSSTQTASGCGKFSYTITRTWTATDVAGNTSTAVQHVTIVDTTAPILAGIPADTSAECGLVPAPASPTATDNCDPNPTVSLSESSTQTASGVGACNYTLTRTWTATDACGNSSTATQTITVIKVNHPPVLTTDSYTFDSGSILRIPAPGVLLNDSDPDGDPISAILVTPPSHGILALNPDGSFTYTPTNNYVGVDTFTYKASDGSLTSAPGLVTINVLPNPIPTFGILAGPITLNGQTGLFEQRVTVTNSGAVTAEAFRVTISGLVSNVTVYNATGISNNVPYVKYNAPLNPSQTVTLILEFYNPKRTAFSDTLAAIPDVFTTTGTNAATGVYISKIYLDTTRRVFIEFPSIVGRTYTILYSDDLNTWKVSTPSITAGSTLTQWYDDGPPKTDIMPANRSYRAILVPQTP